MLQLTVVHLDTTNIFLLKQVMHQTTILIKNGYNLLKNLLKSITRDQLVIFVWLKHVIYLINSVIPHTFLCEKMNSFRKNEKFCLQTSNEFKAKSFKVIHKSETIYLYFQKKTISNEPIGRAFNILLFKHSFE